MVRGEILLKKLYFVRHGLSEMNALGLRAGSTDTPLTDEGREVARQTGVAARELHIDTIVSSPMIRALETAQIIASELGYPEDKIFTSDLLVERHFGVLEGQPYERGQDIDVVEGIELAEDLFKRVRQALAWIESLPGETVLIVSHGATGRAMRHILNPRHPFQGTGFKNAEIVALEAA